MEFGELMRLASQKAKHDEEKQKLKQQAMEKEKIQREKEEKERLIKQKAFEATKILANNLSTELDFSAVKKEPKKNVSSQKSNAKQVCTSPLSSNSKKSLKTLRGDSPDIAPVKKIKNFKQLMKEADKVKSQTEKLLKGGDTNSNKGKKLMMNENLSLNGKESSKKRDDSTTYSNNHGDREKGLIKDGRPNSDYRGNGKQYSATSHVGTRETQFKSRGDGEDNGPPSENRSYNRKEERNYQTNDRKIHSSKNEISRDRDEYEHPANLHEKTGSKHLSKQYDRDKEKSNSLKEFKQRTTDTERYEKSETRISNKDVQKPKQEKPSDFITKPIQKYDLLSKPKLRRPEDEILTKSNSTDLLSKPKLKNPNLPTSKNSNNPLFITKSVKKIKSASTSPNSSVRKKPNFAQSSIGKLGNKLGIPSGLVQLNTKKKDTRSTEEVQEELRIKKALASGKPIEKKRSTSPRPDGVRVINRGGDKPLTNFSVHSIPQQQKMQVKNQNSGGAQKKTSSSSNGTRVRSTSLDDRNMMKKKRKFNDEYSSEEERIVRKRKGVDEALKDPEYLSNNYSSVIQQMFGYNRNRYRDFSDDSDMEAGYDDLRREEARSTKLGRKEDILEEERLEKLKREKEKKKGKA
ncbi:hypothetical protein HDU92_005976 [Lobulomyces angularis]|nr:hypothetical protein HDU92_005976 [Lobulomyces angularis]